MKRLIALLLCFSIFLAGCNGSPAAAPEESNTTPTEPSTADTTPTTEPAVTEETEESENTATEETQAELPSEPEQTALLAVSVPVTSESVYSDDETEIFNYTTQHMQLIHPDNVIADKVVLDFLNRIDDAQEEADFILSAAQDDYDGSASWFPYFYQCVYSPTRIDQGVLSLFGTQNSYSGGIHGNLSCVAANYDLTTGDVLTLGSIMHSDATKEDFIAHIIKELEKIADEYALFSSFEQGVRSRLGGDENLYEDFYFTTTGLAFFFSPYEIAPYASGIITVEIPYNELPGLIYDGYFPAERQRNEGIMHTGLFMETDMEQFDNMAEVMLTSGEEIIVVYPEGTVEDIRITVEGNDIDIPHYTIFAAAEMSAHEAVVISLSQEEIASLKIHYTSDGNISTIPLE